jgi:predicted SprT family Zn-dependent metalloprotease
MKRRYDPAQMILAFDTAHDWAVEALRSAFATMPTRRIPRMTWANYPTTAGRAFFREFEIRLSNQVLQTPEQVHDTVLHEYAHLVVFEKFGTKAKPHGSEWRAVMRQLGLSPTVTHDYPVEKRQMATRYIYRCDLCGFILRRVRPFKRNRIYSHVGCGGMFGG